MDAATEAVIRTRLRKDIRHLGYDDLLHDHLDVYDLQRLKESCLRDLSENSSQF